MGGGTAWCHLLQKQWIAVWTRHTAWSSCLCHSCSWSVMHSSSSVCTWNHCWVPLVEVYRPQMVLGMPHITKGCWVHCPVPQRLIPLSLLAIGNLQCALSTVCSSHQSDAASPASKIPCCSISTATYPSPLLKGSYIACKIELRTFCVRNVQFTPELWHFSSQNILQTDLTSLFSCFSPPPTNLSPFSPAINAAFVAWPYCQRPKAIQNGIFLLTATGDGLLSQFLC